MLSGAGVERDHPERVKRRSFTDERIAAMAPGRIAGMIALLLVDAAAFTIAAAVMPSVTVGRFGESVLAVVVIGLVNGLFWPAIIRFALPLTVLTLGLGALVLNGAVVLFVAWALPGVEIDGLGAAVIVAIVLTAATTITTTLLAIDDDDRFARHFARKRAKQAKAAGVSQVPGVLFLEIDGLAHEVIRRAIRDGNAPTLASWVHDGSHRLLRWETDWSSQTGACQAGLLHGSNEDMPAFRWWEKDRDQAIVTNHPRDAAELERRVSDGRGLLHADGASRANILSGDATHSLLTMSTVLRVRRKGQRIGHDYYTYFADPYNVARTMLLSFVDIARELRAATEQRRRGVRPRIHRDVKYALVRAWATVVQLHLQVEAVAGDLYAGRPVIYTTFLAYDEVAHHSGIERPDALAVLRAVDREIGRLAKIAARAPRPYELVVLSDHGQSQGATFLQRYDKSLEDLVREWCATEHVEASGSGDEAIGRMGAALSEAAQDEGTRGRIIRRATRGRTVDGEVQIERGNGKPDERPEVVVMASGCLGLISFPRLPGRVTRETIEAHYPALIGGLREHPGIGFMLVRTEADGSIVLGPEGERRLSDGSGEGEDPLTPFGPNAVRHVARTDGFAHCPDIVVNSRFWEDTEEVAAFEELVGSHGGLGGTQSYPFVLVPAHFAVPDGEVVGAEAMHRRMREWLAGLGHAEFA
jgi:uncharacterized membrane protein YvlD (DUF360 family)